MKRQACSSSLRSLILWISFYAILLSPIAKRELYICFCLCFCIFAAKHLRITWKIEKKRGNLRPVLTYTVTLEDFERQLATPPLSITSLIPEPPESWQEHCWPGQHERAGQDDAGERPCYQLSIPSHKGRHGSQSLRLPWREDNSYPEVEASFRLLREAFASELERAGASRPMHEENSLELGGTALRSVAPAILGQRFLEAVGKA